MSNISDHDKGKENFFEDNGVIVIRRDGTFFTVMAEYPSDGSCQVWKYASHLRWDEFLGQIASMTMPGVSGNVYFRMDGVDKSEIDIPSPSISDQLSLLREKVGTTANRLMNMEEDVTAGFMAGYTAAALRDVEDSIFQIECMIHDQKSFVRLESAQDEKNQSFVDIQCDGVADSVHQKRETPFGNTEETTVATAIKAWLDYSGDLVIYNSADMSADEAFSLFRQSKHYTLCTFPQFVSEMKSLGFKHIRDGGRFDGVIHIPF